MLSATFRPIERWPGKERPSYARKRSTFKATYAATLDLLEAELTHLNAKDIVIQVALERRDIRNDGWPRSSARPSKPGVIVTFLKNKQVVSFPCDTFDDWEDNLRAIALALQALRTVDRYGVTQNGEQYTGFLALPPAPKEMTPQEAADVLAAHSQHWAIQIRTDPETFRAAYREAARRTHPDQNPGHDSVFIRVGLAKQVLERHHGGAK